jgi:hypothetical protein
MYVMALLDQIPPQYHARFARLFNGLGISHLLSDIERAVEVVAGLREEEGRAAAWGAVDLLSLRAGHWRDLPQLLRDGYFREYLLGDTFYAVPLRCDQWETIMVLRLQEAEVPLLERYGYLTGRWFFSHEEALLDSAKDIFATMLFSRYPLGQAALDELQSNVWHHLPAILRERYANWDQLIAGLGITFARQQGCTRMTMPAASCKVKVSYPLALAVRNYDDPARALGFNPSPNGEYWVLDMV